MTGFWEHNPSITRPSLSGNKINMMTQPQKSLISNRDANLPTLIQECLQTLNRYTTLCQILYGVNDRSSPDFSNGCMDAYILYQTAYEMILERIPQNEEYKKLMQFNELNPNGPVDGYLKVYNQLRNTILFDTKIENIRRQCYNLQIKQSYFSKLLQNSWISLGMLNNIVRDTTKKSLIIQVCSRDDYVRNHIRGNFAVMCMEPHLFDVNSSIIEIESALNKRFLQSESIYFKERNEFDYIIILTTDNSKNNNLYLNQSIVLFEKIAKSLTPKKATGTFPNIFISIIDFYNWNLVHDQTDSIITNNVYAIKQQKIENPPSLTIVKHDYSSPIGIHNQSNSCYINCIIQCLAGCTKFIELLQYEVSHLQLSNNTISHSLWNIFKDMYASSIGPKLPISVEPLKNQCGLINGHFKGNDQEDCIEFCQFLLSTIHEEMNISKNIITENGDNNNNSQKKNISDVQKSQYEWQSYTRSNFSIIVDIFKGQMASQLACKVCSTTSTTFQVFSSLSLPVPLVNTCDFTDCLRQYFKANQLTEPDEQWLCPRCKIKVVSSQQLFLTRLPRMLIVHFNRFNRYVGKNNCYINYPLEIDLQGLMGSEWRNQQMKTKYRLYAVACHTGTLHSGHYTAYVYKGPQRGWYYFDDTKYRTIKFPTEFITPSAYLLFYIRTD